MKHLQQILGAPDAPRAVLVSLDASGELQHEPVDHDHALLNISTDLVDHLDSRPHSTEWLIALRDYCEGRIAARGEAKATGGVSMARPGGWDIVHVMTGGVQ